MGERVPVVPEREILSVYLNVRKEQRSGQRWYIGAFIAFNDSEETYEAALYNGETPTDYPAVLKIVPQEDESPPADFKFYFDNADPITNKWENPGKIKHVSLPVMLGAGNAEFRGMDYRVIIVKRYEKDVWSLFLDNGKKMNEHTVYKIGLRMISTLQYIHSRSWIHGDIKGSNIMVDSSENHIYLVNYHSASKFTSNNEQENSNKARNIAVKYMSRDAHTGVSTMRGDIESLFYNLVEWFGVRLPWEKNLGNVSLVKQQKDNAFTNVEQFLSECFEGREVPGPIRKFMNFIANMNLISKPEYRNLKLMLRNSLTRLCHVPAGNLLFALDNVRDEEIVEVSSELKHNRSRRGLKSKLGASVDQLAKIIFRNCQNENEVNLQGEVVSGSLIHAICQITRMKRTQELQDKLAKAWEKDLEGLRSKTKRLWTLKAQRRATSNTASAEKEHEESSRDCLAGTAASKNVSNLSNPGSSFSRAGTTSQSRTPLPELPPSIDLNIFPLNDARSASSSRSNAVQSPCFRTSTSGYSSRSSSRVGFHPEDPPLLRTPDPFLEKESWHDNYELLDTWLDMKEKDLRDFDPIPPEPRMAIGLVRQVRVLLDDFRSRNLQIGQLSSVQVNLSPDMDYVHKLKQIKQRWQDQLDWLEKCGRELGEASLSQVREALEVVSSNLDKLSDQSPEEQLLRKMEILAGQLEGQRTLLASAETVTKQLCQAFSDASFSADLRTELRSINDLYDDLDRRINVNKAEIERSLSDGRQFDDSCKRIIVWLAKELDMFEKLIVSADPEKLKQQELHCQNVLDKETEVNELLKKGRDFLLRPQNLENITLQQSLLDLMKSQWDRLKKNNLQFSSRLKTCIGHLNNYYEVQKLLLSWLTNIEHKLRSLQPATLDDVKKALTEVSSLRTETLDKSKEFEECVNLGDTYVNGCDEDKDLVKKELIAMKDRWKKLDNSLQERIQFLKDVADRFDVFKKCLNKLEGDVNDLKSRDSLRKESGDPSLIDFMKELRDEADSLRRSPLKDVRQLANELSSIIGKQGLDTNCLLVAVDRVDDDIKNFRIKLVDSLNKAYEQKVASIENDIKPKVNIMQDVKPRILLPTTNQRSVEIIDLLSDSEGEGDFSIDEKPKLLLSETNPLSEGSTDLMSSCDTEADVVTQQQKSLASRAQTHQIHREEGTKKNDEVEQKSKEQPSKEKQDVNDISFSTATDKSENSKKKREKHHRNVSDSDSSDSDCNGKKMKI